MVGQTSSFLALQADIILNTTVNEEACPNNLAPTTSTTAQMVMGDALAICLMEVKGFGQASSLTVVFNIISACNAKKELVCPTMAIIAFPKEE